ncbi:Zinc dependent phospholipase C [Pseudobutyrivibrio sp. OR37]|uniref:zinc dependent phospholipase C family protein n=1 Tax=Pseudobutyrivibrio sp. OR37 TaxID=1798186 RepID=UPI0008E5C270|nr:zinc dependent phospholipase C family protein [Pseudobutyrivibrio sp. OR37]SFH93749.1 Zinc dependent phospholipase C [Pseudobutyrivibrio sp. OR37]
MPGFITHLLFGEQSISFIESADTRSLIERHKTAFSLGLQGPDFFFYHIPAYLCYKKNIGNIMHRSRTMIFFDCLFDARNSFEDAHSRRICDAYILGFIGHYSLDTVCHPYIYYKSEHFKNMKQGKAYDFGRHVSLETDIDHIVLNHYKHVFPSEFDYAGSVCPSPNEKRVISELLYIAINRTYPEDKIRFGTILHAINSFIKLNAKMKDPSGRKKRRIRKIEQIFFKCAVISSMIPSDSIIKYADPCNEEHNTWYNPWNPSVLNIESVFDLINKSMPDYIERMDLYMKSCGNTAFIDSETDVVKETNQFLHYRNSLLVSLSDLSYLSGLPL